MPEVKAHDDRVAIVMGESAQLDPRSNRRRPDAWMIRAACREFPVETFFPEEDGGANRNMHGRYQRARQVCEACPVRLRCLEWALTHNERAGMWGGLTPRQRRGLYRAPR